MTARNRHVFLKCHLFPLLGYLRLNRRRNQVKRKHKFWIKKIFRQLQVNGEFDRLFAELRLHDRIFIQVGQGSIGSKCLIC